MPSHNPEKLHLRDVLKVADRAEFIKAVPNVSQVQTVCESLRDICKHPFVENRPDHPQTRVSLFKTNENWSLSFCVSCPRNFI